jgi:mono/diheme cytochrome c family protein
MRPKKRSSLLITGSVLALVFTLALVLGAAFVLSGCQPEPLPVATVSFQEAGLVPQATPVPTSPLTPQATETTTARAMTGAPGAAHGQQLWQEQSCSLCHGAQAAGGVGPALVNNQMSLATLTQMLRVGRGTMPAFGQDKLSDQDISDIYSWLKQLSGQ